MEILELLMREIGDVAVGPQGSKRRPLREAVPAHDIYAIAMAALRALPGEVLIGRGGCGGENIVAAFADTSAEKLIHGVHEFFGIDDIEPEWPLIDRVPLLKPIYEATPEVWEKADAIVEKFKAGAAPPSEAGP